MTNADEVYENLSVISIYIKANLSNISSGFVYLSDVAPNLPLSVDTSYSGIGYVGENIQFYGNVGFPSGHLSYTYYWDFGDGNTSTQLNPTHTYTKAGDYTFTFTATDSTASTASVFYNITIVEVKKAFLFGSFSNICTFSDFTLVVAANLWMIFKPFQVLHYTDGQWILFLNDYKGKIISNTFLIGMYNVIDLGLTQNIAWTTYVPAKNTATLVLQRLLPKNIQLIELSLISTKNH